jgi:hypothetical protein
MHSSRSTSTRRDVMSGPRDEDTVSLASSRNVTTGLLAALEELPLSAANVRAQLALFEADQAEADRRAHERMLHEQVIVKRDDSEQANEVARFMDQKAFRWSVPQEYVAPADFTSQPSFTADVDDPIIADSVVQPSIIAGMKHRPRIVAAPVNVPDEPESYMDERQIDEAWGERMSNLQLLGRQAATLRRATEFDLEEALFHAQAMSSDDSDGYDADVHGEWREATSELFAVCRCFEATAYAGEKEATALSRFLRERKDFAWNDTEQQMIWEAIRRCYQHAEPLHSKRWLSQMHELLRTQRFDASPSVALFSQLIFAALEVEHLPDHTKRKIRRWANRSTYLVRRRYAVLRELGVLQPTWKDIKASCGGMDRDVPVPNYTLRDTLLMICGDADGDIRVVPEEDLAAEEIAARIHNAANEERQEAIQRIMASGEAEDRLGDDDDNDDDDDSVDSPNL